jgi:hydrogenase maturation factor HypF (carbamoyltransferase family)
MIPSIPSRAIGWTIIIAAILIALVYFYYVHKAASANEVWDMTHQLVATGVSVAAAFGGGILLLDIQSRERNKQLRASLKAELQEVKETLENTESAVRIQLAADPEEQVIVTQISPIILEEFIRSSLASPQNTFAFICAARRMRTYTSELSWLASLHSAGAPDDMVRDETNNIEITRKDIVADCSRILQWLSDP